jgi:hypothetical protein
MLQSRQLLTQPMFQLTIGKKQRRSVSVRLSEHINFHCLAKAPQQDAESAKLSAQNATNFSMLHQIVDFMKKRYLAQVWGIHFNEYCSHFV